MLVRNERKAPSGKFIVGEADMSEGEWGQVGEVCDTLATAQATAHTYKEGAQPQFDYFIYDEKGLIQQIAA